MEQLSRTIMLKTIVSKIRSTAHVTLKLYDCSDQLQSLDSLIHALPTIQVLNGKLLTVQR